MTHYTIHMTHEEELFFRGVGLVLVLIIVKDGGLLVVKSGRSPTFSFIFPLFSHRATYYQFALVKDGGLLVCFLTLNKSTTMKTSGTK